MWEESQINSILPEASTSTDENFGHPEHFGRQVEPLADELQDAMAPAPRGVPVPFPRQEGRP